MSEPLTGCERPSHDSLCAPQVQPELFEVCPERQHAKVWIRRQLDDVEQTEQPKPVCWTVQHLLCRSLRYRRLLRVMRRKVRRQLMLLVRRL